MIPALKFDLKAYTNDGAFVDFETAFLKNLKRYSQTFMREKFFTGEEIPAADAAAPAAPAAKK